jgi:hypothetical protein
VSAWWKSLTIDQKVAAWAGALFLVWMIGDCLW